MREPTVLGLLGILEILYAVPISTRIILIGLSLLASLSPLCTFASFWQIKEWRWDRLREHVKREGIVVLFSLSRLALLATAVVFVAAQITTSLNALVALLSLLTIIGIVQVSMRRQPFPVWTSKAMVLTGVAIVADFLLAIILAPSAAKLSLGLLPFLQFLILATAWSLFYPLDRYLKAKTIRQATSLRVKFPHLRVIGVTGSVGKTTTKELLAHILGDLHPLSTPAHVNSELGVARWLLSILSKTQHDSSQPVIVEMGAYRSGEIATLSRMAQPIYGVITFIGSQHLALFGSREALIAAKGELLESLPVSGKAFINGDSDASLQTRHLCVCPVVVVGTGERADDIATEIEEMRNGLKFKFGQTMFTVPLHGTHNVANVLLAIEVAKELGLREERIAEKLKTFAPLHQTFEVREERGITILDDTHNSSAASFQAAITWADAQPFERKVLLSSGIIELGEESARTHRELGSLASDVFDAAFFLDRKSAELFRAGFEKSVSMLTKDAPTLSTSTLLVCVGRIPPESIRILLPK